MGSTERIPGMKPGRQSRNLLLSIVYAISLAGLVVLVPLTAAYYRPFRGC